MEGVNEAQIKDKVQQGVVKSKEFLDSPNWKPNGKKPCEKFIMDHGPRVAAKGICITPYPIKTVYEFVSNTQEMLKNDEDVLQHKVLKDSQEYKIEYYRYKGFLVVAQRDFVLASTVKEEGSRVIISSVSVDYPHPKPKDVVRGQILVGACILDAVDENSTRITYLSCTDMKGDIPEMFKNKMSEDEGEAAFRISEALKKKHK